MTVTQEEPAAGSDRLTVRPATVADIGLIRQVAAVAFPATYRSLLSSEQLDYMMEWMYSEESLRRQMEVDGHTFYLAEQAGRPCGYVSVQQESADVFHLQKIYVLPASQRGGIGQTLFRTALAHVRRLHPGPCRVELNVNRHNPALGFYEHMGMRRLRAGDFPIGHGYFMTDYIMGLDL